MEKLTFDEIIEKIKNADIAIEDFAYGDFGDYKDKAYFLDGIGTFKEIDKYGGEGKGEEWWIIYHCIEHDVYIRIEGWYSSYEGAIFDNSDYEEVFPKQITVTKFLTKKQIDKIDKLN